MLYIGSSEPYGSWKMGWTRRRKANNCRLLSVEVSTPSKTIRPEVGSSRLSTIWATVDLPEPDSPTIAVVVPRFTLKETSSTALKSLEPAMPDRNLKTLVRFSTLSTSAGRASSTTASAGASSSSDSSPRSLATWMRRDASDGAEATSRLVYGCWGFRSNSRDGPDSTTFPRYMTT